jgi:hypothetical protein
MQKPGRMQLSGHTIHAKTADTAWQVDKAMRTPEAYIRGISELIRRLCCAIYTGRLYVRLGMNLTGMRKHIDNINLLMYRECQR